MPKRKGLFVVLLVAMAVAAAAPPVHAVNQWQRYELELKTEVRYDQANPYRDLQLVAYWSSTPRTTDLAKPSGFGFWDGTRVENGKTYNVFKIRTALVQGTYYLWYKCSGRTPVGTGPDCSADGVLNRTAPSALSIQIGANDKPNNLLYSNGFLQVLPGTKYLTYAGKQSDRFYWQGDTAWPAPAREGKVQMDARAANPNLPAGAVSDTWKSYIDDRVKSTKAYTVVQVAPAVAWQPPQDEPRKSGCGSSAADLEPSVQWSTSATQFPGPETFAFDQISTAGCVGAVPNNCSRWRPEYWREVDAMVNYANSKGIVVLMAGVADPSDRGHCKKSQSYPTKEDSVIFARNLAARLGGNHVVYSVNFDDWPGAVLDYDGRWPGTVHDTTLLVGAELKRAAPRHLVTNHLAGSAPVSVYTPYQSETWLSFQLFHSGHALNVGTACPGSGTTWQAKQKCAIGRALDFTKALRALLPTKPVVNGEGPYEFPGFEGTVDDLPPDNRFGMRHGAYASLFTGAAGSTAGVHGDSKKGQPSIVAWDRPLLLLNSAGASKDMPAIRSILKFLYPGNTTSWGEFNLLGDGILKDQAGPGGSGAGERRIFGGVAEGKNYVAYLPNTDTVSISGLSGFNCSTWTVLWRDPRGGDNPPSPCAPGMTKTQFKRPGTCGNLIDADKRGLCDWAFVLIRPNSISAQTSVSGPYVAASLIEARVDGELALEGGGDRLVAQLMSGESTSLGSENQVSPSEEAFYGIPSVVKESFAGASWIVWEAEDSSAGESTDIFARRVASDGTPLKEAFRVNQKAADRQFDPFTVADAAGNVTVIWTSVTDTEDPDGPKTAVFARPYRGDGTPLGDELMVNAKPQKDLASPVAGADAAGNLVIGWLLNREEIYVRLFTSGGSPRTGEILVAPSEGKQAELVEVVVDPLGSFVVRWDEYSNTDEFLGWYSLAFDATGKPLGDVVSEGL